MIDSSTVPERVIVTVSGLSESERRVTTRPSGSDLRLEMTTRRLSMETGGMISTAFAVRTAISGQDCSLPNRLATAAS